MLHVVSFAVYRQLDNVTEITSQVSHVDLYASVFSLSGFSDPGSLKPRESSRRIQGFFVPLSTFQGEARISQAVFMG